MGRDTTIEWTNVTWNVTRGCTRVSDGCFLCYAERIAHRFNGPGLAYEGLTNEKGRWNGTITFVDKVLAHPLRWKAPLMIFVNSTSDLFHPAIPFEFIAAVFGVMAATPRHAYQILTKRPERIAEFFAWLDLGDLPKGHQTWTCALGAAKLLREEFAKHVGIAQTAPWPLPNVWLGTSVEHQAAADERIPHLLRIPAAVRFLSMEPLLGRVNLGWIKERIADNCTRYLHALHATEAWEHMPAYGRIDWVIVGGESGPGARPMHPDWARALRDQCTDAGVPFFFKQWGEYVWRETRGESTGRPKHYFDDGLWVERVGKKLAGRRLDGRTWDEFPSRLGVPAHE